LRGQKGSDAYAWFVFVKGEGDSPVRPLVVNHEAVFDHVVSCRLELEQFGDYDNDVEKGDDDVD
jgi:hypothetical protein